MCVPVSCVCVSTCLSKCVCVWCVWEKETLHESLCVFLHPCEWVCVCVCSHAFVYQNLRVYCVCACGSIWSASWALWPKSNGRKHQFHHPVSSSSPLSSSLLVRFLLPLLPQLLSSFFPPLLVPCSPRRCDYVPPLSTSDLRGSVCARLHVCICVCLVTAWWSEQPAAAHCAAQFTDDVSRWMPPFTITASPLAAAFAALLLSFLLLCKKKKKSN